MKRRTTWVLAALLCTVAAQAPAQTSSTNTFDNYCRVGAIRTCASVRVLTTWDPVAQVTQVQLWLRNLQGSHPADNTGGAPITRFGLTDPVIRWPGALTVSVIDGALAVGNAASFWSITNRMVEGPVSFSTSTTTAEGGVQGCNVFPSTVQNYFQTCGTGWVVFSFTTRNQWDAANAQVAWKVFTTAADGQTHYACRSENDPTYGEFCEPVDPTVTPEPATVALLATGLAGMAAMRRRRREALGEGEEPEQDRG